MRYVVILSVLLLASTAHAQELGLGGLVELPTHQAVPEGPDRIEYLQEGVRAPYAGMFLDMDTSIRWTNALRWWPEAFRLRLAQIDQTHSAIRTYIEAREQIYRDSSQREIQGLRDDLTSQARDAAAGQPWYDTFGFGFTVGLVLGVVILGVLAGVVAWAIGSN